MVYSQCAPGHDVCSTDPFRCLFMSASADKEDMICLNDRLGDVVLKVEKLRSGSGQDSSTFIRTIDCLKDEIKKIKTAYDLELSRLRRVRLPINTDDTIRYDVVMLTCVDVSQLNLTRKATSGESILTKCRRGHTFRVDNAT